MYEEDIEDFLDHHGIKGMHWGQRKLAARKQARAEMTPQERSSANKREFASAAVGGGLFFLSRKDTLLRLPIAAAIGVGGGVATSALIKKHQNKKLSELGGQ
jgi:hypothetical protein